MPLNYTTHLGRLDHLKNRLALGVRRRIFDLFMRECRPGPDDAVADFGATGHEDHPVHVFFETMYPYPKNLTVIARESEGARWFPERFPGVRFLEADLRSIPLPDGYFHSGLCNAVVEHAGTREQQAALVREVCRVCRHVMFTTPNRRFPVELHTFLPFLHWLPDAQYRAALRLLGLSYFAEVGNLNLLDAPSLLGLFPADRGNRLIKEGIPLVPFVPSNLVCTSIATRA
jgi:SAM-dependent methyltransferase